MRVPRLLAAWESVFARKLGTQALIAVGLLAAPAVLSAPVSGTAQRQVVSGHLPKIAKPLPASSGLDAKAQIQLAIGLPLRNREQLTNLLTDLYNPSSPNFHHYLTPGQFTAAFGPSQEDYQKVAEFAKAHGLTVKRTHPNRTLLDVSGSVADVEKAFHVHLLAYQHPMESRVFFAPDVEPSLDLDTPVLAISGLDNYVKPHPHIHPAATPALPKVRPLGGGGSTGGGGVGSNPGPFEGYDFRDAYAPNVSLDGTGQSVGLFELFGFNPQDIEDYEDEVGISYVNVEAISIDGADTDTSNVDYLDYPGYLDYALEVTSDIEMAIAMAPGLDNVLVYEGPTPQDVPPLSTGTNFIQDASTTAQINDVLNRMATDDLAQQLSCSYGFDINLSTEQIFLQYAAQGQSFFLAGGDSGAYPGAIDEPADNPCVTVVGGTTLTMTAAGDWASETTWLTPATSDPLEGDTPEEASGGGISLSYGIPAWQQGLSMTANQGSTTHAQPAGRRLGGRQHIYRVG
jgi:subtilase family serine protease